MSSENTEDLFLEALTTDVIQAINDLKNNDDPSRRRALIRAVFAEIEGTIYYLKIRLLRRTVNDIDMFSRAELAMLNEENYSIDSRGRAKAHPRFTSIPENYIFTMNMFMRDVLPDFKLDLSDKGWNDFCDSVKIRNRITHPKSNEDLDITECETDKVYRGYMWFKKTTLLGLCDSVEYLRAEKENLKEMAQKLTGMFESEES